MHIREKETVMTNRLYYEEPYLSVTEAEVVSVGEGGFYLDRTIFYPECGGQRGDSGFFGPYRIETTLEGEGGEPLHKVTGELPKVGERHTLSLDWNERYFSMIEHTAQHLISSVLFNSFSIGTVAVHHGGDEITIETDSAEIDEKTLLSVEERAIKLITENRKVWSVEMTRNEALSLPLRRTIKVDSDKVRVVFIENEDITPCGGVHIGNLGEIEEVVYTGSEEIRGHVRTIWRVGRKAREKRRAESSVISSLRKKLSTDAPGLTNEVERLLSENRDLKREKKNLERALAEEEFDRHEGDIIVYSTHYPLDSLIEKACSKNKKIFILGEGRTFLFAGEKTVFEALKEKFSLRGGGREPLFRGTCTVFDGSFESGVESFLASL